MKCVDNMKAFPTYDVSLAKTKQIVYLKIHN